MFSIAQTILCTLLGVVGLVLWKLRPFFIRPFTSKIRSLPGPPPTSLIWGNMKEIIDEDNSVPQERWVEQYGHTIMYRGFLGVRTVHCKRIVHRMLTRILHSDGPSLDYGHTRTELYHDALGGLSEALPGSQQPC